MAISFGISSNDNKVVLVVNDNYMSILIRGFTMANVIGNSVLRDAVDDSILAGGPFDDVVTITLIQSSFEATPTTDLSTLTAATFTGSASKDSGNTYTIINDPITNTRYIYIPEPAGGWKWTCSATPSPAQTIYGAKVGDYGCFNIPPVLVSAIGDTVLIGDILIPLPIG